MLYIVFAKSDEEASKLTGKQCLEFPDIIFMRMTSKHDFWIDELFKRLIKEIDDCDMPMKNVIRDLKTENTHDIQKVSTGVKSMWLAAHTQDYVIQSKWFGENCYQVLFDISQNTDIIVYDDSAMFFSKEGREVRGVFTDYITGEIVHLINDNSAMDFFDKAGYWV